MADLREALEKIRERVGRASPAKKINFTRYEHGGGRAYVEGDAAGQGRTLVVDAYNEPDREFYFSAPADVPAIIKACDILANRLQTMPCTCPAWDDIHSDDCAQVLARAALSAAAEALEKEK